MRAPRAINEQSLLTKDNICAILGKLILTPSSVDESLNVECGEDISFYSNIPSEDKLFEVSDKPEFKGLGSEHVSEPHSVVDEKSLLQKLKFCFEKVGQYTIYIGYGDKPEEHYKFVINVAAKHSPQGGDAPSEAAADA